MKTIRTKVYQFSELNETAKKKAIESFYDINVDYDWWNGTYYDFQELCKTIGIDVDLKKTYFSGFSHQGQGASFTADIDLMQFISGINEKKYLSHAPQIEKEVRFNPAKCEVDKRVLALIEVGIIDVSIEVKAHDRPYSTKVSVSCDYQYNQCLNYRNIDKQLEILEAWIEDVVNDLDSVLFRLLENEYDYLTSEEAIIETIEANEYDFTMDGNRFHQ